MATSSTLNNLLSFFLPKKQSQPAPPQLNLNLSSSNQTQKPSQKQNLVPIVSQNSSSSELSSVICPSLAYSNTFFFRSAYNVQVVVGEEEPEERLLNRFRREVFRAGVIQESKRRRFFENKQEEKKRKSREAAKRNRKRRPMPRISVQKKQDGPTIRKEEDEDNWDLPEGDTL